MFQSTVKGLTEHKNKIILFTVASVLYIKMRPKRPTFVFKKIHLSLENTATTTLLSWRNCEPNSKVTWFDQRNDDLRHASNDDFRIGSQFFHESKVVVSSLTWWPRRCATGEAWPNIMLSCQAGRPCDVRAHRNRLTTWPPHVITRYFCFLLMQNFDTGKHSYSHRFFLFFWRVKVCWNGCIYWLIDFKNVFLVLHCKKEQKVMVVCFGYWRCVALVISDTPHDIQSRVVI